MEIILFSLFYCLYNFLGFFLRKLTLFECEWLQMIVHLQFEIRYLLLLVKILKNLVKHLRLFIEPNSHLRTKIWLKPLIHLNIFKLILTSQIKLFIVQNSCGYHHFSKSFLWDSFLRERVFQSLPDLSCESGKDPGLYRSDRHRQGRFQGLLTGN